jgi:hypothetical protein
VKIDGYSHILPRASFDRLVEVAPDQGAIKPWLTIPALHDLEAGLAMMEEFGADYRQILTLSMPALETVAGPAETPALSRLANDSMARPGFLRGRAGGVRVELPLRPRRGPAHHPRDHRRDRRARDPRGRPAEDLRGQHPPAREAPPAGLRRATPPHGPAGQWLCGHETIRKKPSATRPAPSRDASSKLDALKSVEQTRHYGFGRFFSGGS